MSERTRNGAVLHHPVDAMLAPLDLGIASQFQFCVDAGAAAAADFFGHLADFNLHDHIAYALQAFAQSVGIGMAASGTADAARMQACTDAFAAGYLGRVQQELRLFHGEAKRQANPARRHPAATNTNTMN